jgi:hypothetical protein
MCLLIEKEMCLLADWEWDVLFDWESIVYPEIFLSFIEL